MHQHKFTNLNLIEGVNEIEINSINFEDILNLNERIYASKESPNWFNSSHYIESWEKSFRNFSHKNNKKFIALVFYSSSCKENYGVYSIYFLIRKNFFHVKVYNNCGVFFGYPSPNIFDNYEDEFIEAFSNFMHSIKYYVFDFYPTIYNWLKIELMGFGHLTNNEIHSQNLRFNGTRMEFEILRDAPYIKLNLNSNLPINARLRTKIRSTNKLISTKNSVLSYKEFMGESISLHLSKLFLIHKLYWGKSSNFNYHTYQNFIELITSKNSLQGETILSCLYLDQIPIAACLGVIQGKKYFYWIPTYDLNHSQYIPGHLLISSIIDSMKSKGVEYFDFLNSGESYKFRWTDKALLRYKYYLYSHRFLGKKIVNFRKIFIGKVRFEIKKLLGLRWV